MKEVLFKIIANVTHDSVRKEVSKCQKYLEMGGNIESICVNNFLLFLRLTLLLYKFPTRSLKLLLLDYSPSIIH